MLLSGTSTTTFNIILIAAVTIVSAAKESHENQVDTNTIDNSGDAFERLGDDMDSTSVSSNDLVMTSNSTTVLTYINSISASSPSSSSNSDAVADGVDPVSLIVAMTMLVVLSIFGTLGNGLVLYVFTRKSDKVTSTIFILALAWTDLFTCLIVMPMTVTNIQLNSHLKFDFICKLYQFLITCNVPLSAFIMVAIAVDRYFSICHPFLHVVTPRRARISILCLCLLAFFLGTMTTCMYSVYEPQTISVTGDMDWCLNITSGTDQPVAYPNGSSGTSRDHIIGGPLSLDGRQPSMVVEIIITNSSYNSNYDSNVTATSPLPALEDVRSCTENVTRLVYNGGLCEISVYIFTLDFIGMYQKVYMSFYMISLLSVFTLYFFIYRSVVKRRAWRRKQKSWSHSPMTVNTAAETAIHRDGNKARLAVGDGNDNIELAPHTTVTTCTSGFVDDEYQNDGAVEQDENTVGVLTDKASAGKAKTSPNAVRTPEKDACDGDATATTPIVVKEVNHENGVETSATPSSAEKKTIRERRDFNFLANIRTAVMLFVVAVVFIFSFLPAWLMATGLIDYSIIIFYMYFVYNVANPVIYAFMNQSFRKELKRVFQRDCGLNCYRRYTHGRCERGISRSAVTAFSVCESPDEVRGYGVVGARPSDES